MRVRAAGRFARILSGFMCLVMAGAVTNGVFGHYGAPSRGELVLWGVAISILALIVVRAAMIGVWVGPARTRVRGWLLSVRFEND